KSEAKVIYDGAEVVKEQTGKMTFKKDVKVYKKNPDGSFSSLLVKRNKFFRTYDIEKYGGKTFYRMGQYRVQATDLVVFKEVPIKIRSSFYNDPMYIIINRDGKYSLGSYGTYFKDVKDGSGSGSIIFRDSNNVQRFGYCEIVGVDSELFCHFYPGEDLKIAETITRESRVRYELTKDAGGKTTPLDEAKSTTMHEKGTIVLSIGPEVNGYLDVYVSVSGDENPPYKEVWLPVNILKPVGDK
ncbi:MAG: hypothetical protein RR595_12530, partial [Lysinibacillus sp.]